MILGIGCDILDIKRFQKACNTAFIKRVFTDSESNFANTLKGRRKTNFLAKRFAGKEALAKACGTGIGDFIGWQDIEILNDENGAPILKLSKKAQKNIQKRFKCRQFHTHISLSDDNQAMAFVILEK
jgi:holo-[acyl-carrier protein] synthase